MIRARTLIVGLLATSAAAPAFAQTVQATPNGSISNYTVVGTVPEMCVLGEPTQATSAPSINVKTIIGRVVRIQDLVDPDTLSTRAASIDLAFDAMCNYPYQVTLESNNNGLFREGAGNVPPVGFANGVPYRAELFWDDARAVLDADALNRQERRASFGSDEPSSGALTLRLGILPGATNVLTRAPILAGDYRDSIRITLGPR